MVSPSSLDSKPADKSRQKSSTAHCHPNASIELWMLFNIMSLNTWKSGLTCVYGGFSQSGLSGWAQIRNRAARSAVDEIVDPSYVLQQSATLLGPLKNRLQDFERDLPTLVPAGTLQQASRRFRLLPTTQERTTLTAHYLEHKRVFQNASRCGPDLTPRFSAFKQHPCLLSPEVRVYKPTMASML